MIFEALKLGIINLSNVIQLLVKVTSFTHFQTKSGKIKALQQHDKHAKISRK